MRHIRISLIIILVLTIACIGVWVYNSSVLSKSNISPEQEASTEVSEASEDNQAYMTVTNQDILYEALPSIAPTVISQIYVQNYEKDSLIDRHATIEGDIVQKNNEYTFTIHFLESDVKRNVTVTIINASTDNYDITVGDKL